LNKLFSILNGEWEGIGDAEYLDVYPVKYTEHITFELAANGSYLTYRDISRILEPLERKDEIIFDESGFFIVKDDAIKLINAQKSGRIEEYECKLKKSGKNTIITAQSTMTNEDRLVRIVRDYNVNSTVMTYTLKMELVYSPGLRNHLSCTLNRIK
jgi:hypothetical protein